MISKYRSLMIAKSAASILTAAYIVLAMFLVRDSLPAFYILMANNLFPVIIGYVISQQKNLQKYKKEQTVCLLPRLIHKYHYSAVSYQNNSISFLLTCLFLFLWQQREETSYVPISILCIVVVIRFFGIGFYIYRIHRSYRNVNN